jgi:hypothetical protein
MGLRELVTVRPPWGTAPLKAQVAEANLRADQIANSLEIAEEGLGRLQMALEDVGWTKMASWGEKEFTREGLRNACRLNRVMAAANPLIKRGLSVRYAYIFGGGFEIKAKDETVNKIVQRTIADKGNQRSVFGKQACETNERTFGTDGNMFFAAFANPRTGHVQFRTIPFDQIEDVFYNPQDRSEPWFYLRRYVEKKLQPDGTMKDKEVKVYHPDIDYRPQRKYRTIGDIKVDWTAPLIHQKVNAQDGWRFGIGDAYAAIPWARTYRDFLADWATLIKALSQFAFKVSGGNQAKADQLRQQVARAQAQGAPVGQTAVTDALTTLEAIPKTGATIDSESGKPLAAMVAAALGISVVTLLGDPGQTGARAVAETLDVPTANEMNGRRNVWDQTFQTMMQYAIEWAIRAPGGELQGSVTRNTWSDDLEIVTPSDTTVEVTWASLKDASTASKIQAIVNADSTGKMPPLITLKLMLEALEVPNVEDLINEFKDLFKDWDPLAPPEPASGSEVGHKDSTLRDGKKDGKDSEKSPKEREADS